MVPPHEDPALRLRVVTLRVTLMDPATWSRNHAARRRSLLVDDEAAAAAPQPAAPMKKAPATRPPTIADDEEPPSRPDEAYTHVHTVTHACTRETKARREKANEQKERARAM